MGRKVNPIGFRLGVILPWKSKWFFKKNSSERLLEDIKIRRYIEKNFKNAGIADVTFERSANQLTVNIATSRPGILIGRKGLGIEELKKQLQKFTNSEVSINIEEVKDPYLSAPLIAAQIAEQIEKRVAFRRAVKKALDQVMKAGAIGVKIRVSGRLNGVEIARSEMFIKGKVPTQTIRANVDYGFAEAFTTYGVIGIKVWIYKGDFPLEKKGEKNVNAKKT